MKPVFKPARYLEPGDKVQMSHDIVAVVEFIEHAPDTFRDTLDCTNLDGTIIKWKDAGTSHVPAMFACQVL